MKVYSNKKAVLKAHPGATASKDVDGFWWVRRCGEMRALNDARNPVRSAAAAWKMAAEALKPNGEVQRPAAKEE